jgi:hypothetical protein
MASLWLAEKYDTDRKLRGANDPMGEPLSDEMRAALVDLMAVLPSFVRQFPKVLQIEADREDFFADALQLDSAERAAIGAEEARLIAPEDAQPLTEGVAAARGEGPLADRAGRSVVRSLRNLASAGFIAGFVFGQVGSFVSGEVLGGIADGVGIEIRAPMSRWVRGRHEDIQTLFATAPPDLRIAIAQHIEALMDPGPIPAPTVPPAPKGRTWIVDPAPGRGDFTMIQPAIDAAAAGDAVVVREGTYRDSLLITRPISLQGEGDIENILVTADKGDALRIEASSVRVGRMRFLRESIGNDYGIWMIAGNAELVECIVESYALACIDIMGNGTAACLRNCLIRNGAGPGLSVHDGAEVLAEDCRFLSNSLPGVDVEGKNTLVNLRRCISESGQSAGYRFHDRSSGFMEKCESVNNALDGVDVRNGAGAEMRNCFLKRNKRSGILSIRAGRVSVYKSLISGNGDHGIYVGQGGSVTVENCALAKNRKSGVSVKHPDCFVLSKSNDLRGNAHGPWDIAEGATIIDENNLT